MGSICRLLAMFLIFANSMCFAAITSEFDSGNLIVSTDADDDIIITASNGLVKINGRDPASGIVNAADVKDLRINGGPGNNVLDASAVTAAAGFTMQDVEVDIFGREGNDIITGAGITTNAEGNGGIDTLTGGTGGIAYTWTFGDGNDTISNGNSEYSEINYFVASLFLSNIPTTNTLQNSQGNLVITQTLADPMTSETLTLIDIDDVGVFAPNSDNIILFDDLSPLQFSQFSIFPGSGRDFVDSSQSGVGIKVSLQRSSADSVYLADPDTLSTFGFRLNITSPSTFTLSKDSSDILFSRSAAKARMNGFTKVELEGGRAKNEFIIENLEGTHLEFLTIECDENDDTIQMVGSAGVSISLKGDSEFNPDDTPAVDSLTIDAEMLPVDSSPGEISIEGKGLITHTEFENVTIINQLHNVADSWSLN